MSSSHHPHTSARRLSAGIGASLAAAALVLVAPAAASAHVHVEPSSTEPGAVSELGFAFGHGCDGSATTGVAVTIPEEITAVSLINNPGWAVAVEVVDGARTVAFTADEPMPDGIRETLELEVTLPEGAADGTVLAFPALQTCEVGETLWGSLEEDSDTPAPTITIGETADAHGHTTEDTEAGDTGDTGAESAAGDDADAASTDAPADAESTDRAAQAVEAEGSMAMPLAITALVIALVAAALAAFSLFRRRES